MLTHTQIAWMHYCQTTHILTATCTFSDGQWLLYVSFLGCISGFLFWTSRFITNTTLNKRNTTEVHPTCTYSAFRVANSITHLRSGDSSCNKYKQSKNNIWHYHAQLKQDYLQTWERKKKFENTLVIYCSTLKLNKFIPFYIFDIRCNAISFFQIECWLST